MKVGFVINSRWPSLKAIWKGMSPAAMIFGWDDAGSSMSYMRFRWIARFQPKGVQYELYRPGNSYDVVVFLKSMGSVCREAAQRLRDSGTAVIFEANVDYYTPWNRSVPMDVMSPTALQRVDAEQITKEANVVIASSRHLAQVCAGFNPHVYWVPDNILPEFCQIPLFWEKGGKLKLWWSGMASKLFELLAAEESLRHFRDHIHLHIVTNRIEQEKAKWQPEVQARFESFIKVIPHTFHRFKSIPHLLNLYANGGGVFIAPRFLEFPYNLGHSEWKITLGMSCGLPVLASPVPSYEDVAQRTQGDAIRICRTNSEWEGALEWALSRSNQPSEAAREVVRRYYLTPVIAEQHREAVQSVFSKN